MHQETELPIGMASIDVWHLAVVDVQFFGLQQKTQWWQWCKCSCLCGDFHGMSAKSDLLYCNASYGKFDIAVAKHGWQLECDMYYLCNFLSKANYKLSILNITYYKNIETTNGWVVEVRIKPTSFCFFQYGPPIYSKHNAFIWHNPNGFVPAYMYPMLNST